MFEIENKADRFEPKMKITNSAPEFKEADSPSLFDKEPRHECPECCRECMESFRDCPEKPKCKESFERYESHGNYECIGEYEIRKYFEVHEKNGKKHKDD